MSERIRSAFSNAVRAVRQGVVLVFGGLIGVAGVPAFAEGVVITWVSEKQQPLAQVGSLLADDETLAKQLETLRKTVGEEAARQLGKATAMAKESSPEIDRDLTRYSFGIANQDLVRRATGVEVLIELYDDERRVVGELTKRFGLSLGPKEDTTLSFDCEDDVCRDSVSAMVTIVKADLVALDIGAANEFAFEWRGRRWFLEDNWQSEGTLEMRTFSRRAYGDSAFDGRVFPPGRLEHNDKRYYRLSQELPGRYPEDPIAYEFEEGGVGMAYAYGLLPGFVVKDGQRGKPALLDGEISNAIVDGKMVAEELVQIRAIDVDKKSVLLVVSPVCDLRSRHRPLRAKIRFVFDKTTMKGPDQTRIEEAVAAWLRPVSIGEVARQCGPTSGTLVKTWTKQTTSADVEEQLGAPDARAETADGEVLVYGGIKLEFKDGRLVGYERRAS